MNQKIVNSSIASSAKLYRNLLIQNSCIGKNVSIGDDTMLLDSSILDYVAINRRNYIQKSTIGEFSYTNFNTVIRNSFIGKFCSISWNVSIGGKDHDYTKISTHSNWRFNKAYHNKDVATNEYEQSSCRIGNDVWIAANAIILRDVTIGNGAVIGAGAIVTKDIEPYSIVVGSPAKTIKKRFDEKTIEILENIQWWNWPSDIINQNQELIYKEKLNEKSLAKLQEISNLLKTE